MATLTERNVVLVSKDTNGNTCLDYPLTKAEQVEDLEEYVKNHSTQLDLPLSIANGGTGQTTVAGVRNTLGLGKTTGAVPIANGGTGATDAATARKNLGLTNTGVDAKAYIVETYRNGTKWYRVWSDGWLEQGGRTKGNKVTITLLKPYSDDLYNIYTTPSEDRSSDGSSGGTGYAPFCYAQTNTSFQISSYNSNSRYTMWYVCGQGA